LAGLLLPGRAVVASRCNASGDFGGIESSVFGVAHNEDALPSMRGIEGASWNIERPAGVTFTFQAR
jgi:hypothetical protein